MSSTSYGLHSAAQVSGSGVIWRQRADTESSLGNAATHNTKVKLTKRLIDLSDGVSQQSKQLRIPAEKAAEVFNEEAIEHSVPVIVFLILLDGQFPFRFTATVFINGFNSAS